MTSREFKQNTGRAKRAARKGPVFITDRGRRAYALLSIEQYRNLTGDEKSIVEILAMPGVAEIDFEPPRLGGKLFRPADFS